MIFYNWQKIELMKKERERDRERQREREREKERERKRKKDMQRHINRQSTKREE